MMINEKRAIRSGLLAAFGGLFVLLGGCANLGAFADTGSVPAPAAEAVESAVVEPDAAWWGPLGWAGVTKGGAGGDVLRVTTLAGEGPGSLRDALEADGPRIVVFEVGGVIDLGGREIAIRNPYVTIAGQTAPSPGITLIRGGLIIAGHDVIVQHLRIRPGDLGEAFMSGRDIDAISTLSAYNVIVDHCTLSWSTDENLSASGPRFTGETPDDWREGTSHRITFSNNLVSEGLAHATHAKGEHSKGSLIHDNVSDILIYGNLYAHNFERSPLFKGGVHGAIVNNFIYNPGQRAIHYNLQELEWGDMPVQTGQMTVIGNVMRAGPSTLKGLPMIMFGGEGDLDLYANDNISVDRWGRDVPLLGRYTTGRARIVESASAIDLPDGVTPFQAQDVEHYVLANAGARPWDRDQHDVRVFADVAEGRGEIIDSQERVGGYPDYEPSARAFDPSLWDMETMKPARPEALDSGAKANGT
tara:strand:+ start:66 stop:1481 length:1416 start_codon:yes stop_codon:yes gene_type:complete